MYRKAAEGGDEEAMYWLGQCYELGIGVEADAKEAAYWTEQAKEHGVNSVPGPGGSQPPASPGP